MSPSVSDFVTLVSNDGFEFIVRRSSAYVAGTIKRMLDPTSNFAEAISGRCVFNNINGIVLEKVCEYLYYNEKYKNAKDVPDMDIPPELCLELLMASDYLNV
ncbi:MAG: transcriptional elongation regulator Elc1 Elongin C [Lasallia pustulata]|uniref:Elongin-C n=1 Tax=Lasallia pustulata TaxID=136370 RepID=A0A5M8PCI7_9LECA|nr:MAG: transcriptional elongation regulator Elc1 Elongin C [Lasallia pustulata]